MRHMVNMVMFLLVSVLILGCAVPVAAPVSAPTLAPTEVPAEEPPAAIPTATNAAATEAPLPAALPSETPTLVPPPILSATATRVPPAERLTSDSQTPSETVRGHILRSYTHWKSIFADATYVIYPAPASSAQPAAIHAQAWISQPGQARVLTGPAGVMPETLEIADGKEVVTIDLKTGESNRTPMPGLATTGDELAATLPTALGSQLALHLMPAGLATCGGAYHTMQTEPVAGRESVAVLWEPPADPSCMPAINTRYWVDADTGVLLRSIQYDGDRIVSDVYINYIEYDPEIPAEYFVPVPGEKPDFAALPGPASDEMQQLVSAESGFSLDIPATWQVSSVDHNAIGLQVLMGPPPISWVSGQAAPVQISVADTGSYSLTDVLGMLFAGCPEPPVLEDVTLSNGIQAQHAAGPPQACADEYLIEHGTKMIFVAMDPAKSGISWETLFRGFRLIDIQ